MYRTPTILKRHPLNPVIKPMDYPDTLGDVADCVLNPGQAMYHDKTVLLVSVCLRNKPHCETHVAMSDDGVHFTINPKPCFFRDPDKVFGEYDNHRKRRIYPIYQRGPACGMLSSVAAGDRFGGGSKQDERSSGEDVALA